MKVPIVAEFVLNERRGPATTILSAVGKSGGASRDASCHRDAKRGEQHDENGGASSWAVVKRPTLMPVQKLPERSKEVQVKMRERKLQASESRVKFS
jgi:hypothetical protein